MIDNVARAFACHNRSFAIDTSGRLWGWGVNNPEGPVICNQRGIVGDGTNQNRHTPVQVMDNVDSVVIGGVDVGSNSKMALRNDGSLWVWGFLGNERIIEPRHFMDGVLLPK